MTARCPNYQETLGEKKLYCTYKSWKLRGTSGATQRGCGGQGEKKASLGYRFDWGQEWGLRVSGVQSSVVNLKPKSRNLKSLEVKTQAAPGISY